VFVRVVVVCIAYYNGGGCWLFLLVMKRGVLFGRGKRGELIRGIEKEKYQRAFLFCFSAAHPNDKPHLSLGGKLHDNSTRRVAKIPLDDRNVNAKSHGPV